MNAPDFKVAAPSRISRRLFRQALRNRKSPVVILADAAYDVCVYWGVDPACALAFFIHESTAGTKGVAVRSRNWGNLRKGRRAFEHKGGFAWYTNWLSSLDDFCELLLGPLYVGSGRETVSEILPRYAPWADNNNPAAYAAAVNAMVARWARLTKKGG